MTHALLSHEHVNMSMSKKEYSTIYSNHGMSIFFDRIFECGGMDTSVKF
jgi:hypothetical protein